MNSNRFDELVLTLGAAPSRRGVLRALGTGATTAVLTALGLPRGVSARCKRDGATCKNDRECCSGTCKGKKRKKRKCRTSPEARGCTIDDPYATPCPDRTNNNQFCWVTLGGKPFCGRSFQCFDCSSNQHCAQQFTAPGARCVKVGPEAGCGQFNNRSCVIYP